MVRVVLTLTLMLLALSARAQSLTDPRVVAADPNILAFPASARIESFGIVPGRMAIQTSGADGWVPVNLDGAGTLQIATLWVGLRIGGQWYVTAAERLRPNQINGTKPVATESVTDGRVILPVDALIGYGWLAASRWTPMWKYVPAPGEPVAFMVAAGSTRLDSKTPTRARTGWIVVEWPGTSGADPMRILWREGDGVAPPDVPRPPQGPGTTTTTSIDLTPLVNQLAGIEERIADLSARLDGHAARTEELAAHFDGNDRQILEAIHARATTSFQATPLTGAPSLVVADRSRWPGVLMQVLSAAAGVSAALIAR